MLKKHLKLHITNTHVVQKCLWEEHESLSSLQCYSPVPKGAQQGSPVAT